MISSSPESEAGVLLRSSKLPSLDGWRAVSIVLVLGTHARFTSGFPAALDPAFHWLFDGNLGVRTFFLISGFLITWLLLAESTQTGRINLTHFYARRALRILPVYWAYLLVLAGLQFLTTYRQSAEAWACNLTFTTNFYPHGSWTVGHLWSIAVEEQFYLLWPGVFVLFGLARQGMRKALLLLAVPILVAPICRLFSYLHAASVSVGALFSSYSFLNYFDSLAMGCAGAFVYARRRDLPHYWLTTKPRLAAGVALGLIFLPYAFTHCFALGVFTVPFAATFQGFGIAALILQSLLLPAHGFYRVLNTVTMRKVGVLSYSIYIWQQLFCSKPEAFGWHDVWWMSFPWWLVPVVAVSMVSYYGLERPLFRLRARLRPFGYASLQDPPVAPRLHGTGVMVNAAEELSRGPAMAVEAWTGPPVRPVASPG
jgi:peptidoglycan/LPS O-acetylase OafA/YrhL